MFRRKHGASKRRSASKTDDVNERDVKTLAIELERAVDTYDRLTHTELPNGLYGRHVHFDFPEETSLKRADIHGYIEDLGESIDSAIVSRIIELDKHWQSRVLREKEPDFQIIDVDRKGRIPYSEWWWWVDQIETLSDSEKSTL